METKLGGQKIKVDVIFHLIIIVVLIFNYIFWGVLHLDTKYSFIDILLISFEKVFLNYTNIFVKNK